MQSEDNTQNLLLACDGHGSGPVLDRGWACPQCGATKRPYYDYDRIRKEIHDNSTRPKNIYRFSELLPVRQTPSVGLLTGWTPLIHAERLGERLGLDQLYLKLDCYNWPSYSYKDRVVAVALQRAIEDGASSVACVSTGNVGNSLAALAAISGIKALIFYPTGLERAKSIVTLSHGASIVEVNGSFDDTNAICKSLALRDNITFLNIGLRPYYAEGAKTMAFEIVEQLGWQQPDHVVLPAAGVALLTRAAHGFGELVELGLADGPVPRLHAAQAEGSAPIAHAFQNNLSTIKPCIPNTIAKSLAIGNPVDGTVALRQVRNSGGTAQDASDKELLEGIDLLAVTEGIYTEPAGGVAVAVTRKLAESGLVERSQTVVTAITGTGLKTQEVSTPHLERIHRIGRSYEEASELVSTLV